MRTSSASATLKNHANVGTTGFKRDRANFATLAYPDARVAGQQSSAETAYATGLNLGTGVGYSVLDMLHAFEKACGKTLAYEVVDRRPGDIAACYADPAKAAEELDWRAEYGIERMCADSWRWQSQNPNGFED